jgi:arginine utilization protein RocB
MNSPLASGATAAAWALELTAVPSVTGTPDEAAFAGWLRGRIADLPAFAGARGRVWTIPVPGDALGRACVAALVPGRGRRTVVLTGHFDTVTTDGYGDLAPLATRPHELRVALVARLAARGAAATPAEALALADLVGGAFLPGRGLLDMKAGLAAGLAALLAFAAEPADREGNLLFLAVPDEEAGSAGARAAAAVLPALADELGLSLAAAVNLDAMADEGDGAEGRRVALGTVGKLLPSALVVGRAVHAADALRGVNAGALAGRIAAAVECSGALAERTGEEAAAPPTLLGLKDGRSAYDVTTPERTWLYWNVMTHRRDPAEVLATLAGLCREVADDHVRRLTKRARILGADAGPPAPAVPVITFSELRREALRRDPGYEAGRAALAREVADHGLDLPEQCRLLTEHAWAASGRAGPAVVLGFASVPYLPTTLAGPGGERLEAAVRRAADTVAARHVTTIGTCRYIPGISDMSFLGQADSSAVPRIAADTPAWGFGLDWPADGGIAGLPIVNAGPWGRDYHTPLERVHAGYAFEVLPDLVLAIAWEVLAGAPGISGARQPRTKSITPANPRPTPTRTGHGAWRRAMAPPSGGPSSRGLASA